MVLASSIRLALFVVVATALFTGCGGAVNPTAATPFAAPEDSLGPSWMDPSAVGRRLLYVSTDGVSYHGAVYVYGYDNPTKLVGKLTGFSQPGGECTDKAGDIFIADFYLVNGRITEYRHAGTHPIATFEDPYEDPTGCAVDPKSGKLAVANALPDSTATLGDVAIYTDPKHVKTYVLPYGLPGPPAYDAAGDLLMEGMANPPPAYGLEELPAGASAFKKIALQGAAVGSPDGVMWDGHYFVLTLIAGGSHVVTGLYRVNIVGSVATVQSSVTLTDSCDQKTKNADVPNPWVEGNVVSGGNNACKHRFDYWNYAKGGQPIRSIPRAIAPAQSEGEAVSE
jgi:hypothetical protein